MLTKGQKEKVGWLAIAFAMGLILSAGVAVHAVTGDLRKSLEWMFAIFILVAAIGCLLKALSYSWDTADAEFQKRNAEFEEHKARIEAKIRKPL